MTDYIPLGLVIIAVAMILLWLVPNDYIPHIFSDSEITTREVVQIGLSLLLLLTALYIIVSDGFDGDRTKWAIAVVGTLTGYWLSPGNPVLDANRRRREPPKLSERR
jgi:hypothetical protein